MIARTAIILSAMIAILGCGDSGEYSGPVGTVTGKVYYDAKPIPEGTIMTAIHKESGYAASARIGADGKYALIDVRTGTYTLGFAGGGTAPVQLDPDEAMKQIQAGTLKEPDTVLPESLRSAESSDVTLDVKEGNQEFNLTL